MNENMNQNYENNNLQISWNAKNGKRHFMMAMIPIHVIFAEKYRKTH